MIGYVSAFICWAFVDSKDTYNRYSAIFSWIGGLIATVCLIIFMFIEIWTIK